MNNYRADMHIHTVLSPCGDLDMSPSNIVARAKECNLDIIGITDHNSTLHCHLISHLAKIQNITVICGAEVTTKEEVHCLVYFENFEKLNLFQVYIEKHLVRIKNDPQRFGYQVVVDENEQIIKEVEDLLISSINQSVEDVETMTHKLDGIFIPAHINKSKNSIISQLGFIPFDLKADAFEVTANTNTEDIKLKYKYLQNKTLVKNSDAHMLLNIGSAVTIFTIKEPTFAEIKKALSGEENRKVKTL